MAKKDFKAAAVAQLDPITQFISAADPEQQEPGQEQPAADAEPIKKSAKKKSTGGNIEKAIQAQLASEKKTKKAQLLFKPSTYEGLQKAAAGMGTSVNNLINILAEDFLKNK